MTGPPDIMELAQRLGRQALHAKLLGFCHPVTGIHHRFEAELPLDMNQALDGLRALSTKLP
jgi:23S rRNA pseudouridine1911/1915/1917 synthase